MKNHVFPVTTEQLGTKHDSISTEPEPALGAPRAGVQLGPKHDSISTEPEPALGAPRDGVQLEASGNLLRGWYRRFLPHRDEPSLVQFITYRLADSIPQYLLTQLKAELESIPPERQSLEYRKRIENWLDAGYGSCLLREPQAAEVVVNNWKHFDGKCYDLIAWVVMPNHVHVLIKPLHGCSLAKIVQSWKSFTARKILSLNQSRASARGSQDTHSVPVASKPFWMREFWDRYMRDENHLLKTVEYIHNNPVKAGLIEQPDQWLWSSAAEGKESFVKN